MNSILKVLATIYINKLYLYKWSRVSTFTVMASGILLYRVKRCMDYNNFVTEYTQLLPYPHPPPHPPNASNTPVTLLVLLMSMSVGNRLPSGDATARLPVISWKKYHHCQNTFTAGCRPPSNFSTTTCSVPPVRI